MQLIPSFKCRLNTSNRVSMDSIKHGLFTGQSYPTTCWLESHVKVFGVFFRNFNLTTRAINTHFWEHRIGIVWNLEEIPLMFIQYCSLRMLNEGKTHFLLKHLTLLHHLRENSSILYQHNREYKLISSPLSMKGLSWGFRPQ